VTACPETAWKASGVRFVEAFAGAWYGKAQFEGGITPDKARRFAFVMGRLI
jgi:hypothetical protein